METLDEARTEDIPRLAALLGLLFAQEADFTPDPARQCRALALLLAQPETGRVYCARRGPELLGMVSLLFTISTAEGGRVAWLEDMVVAPAERGRGLGGRLLRFAVDEARRLGCSRLTLLTDTTNDAAQRFYAREGFTRSAMLPMRRAL